MEDDATVTDDTMELQLPQSLYEARGYEPPFALLPLCTGVKEDADA